MFELRNIYDEILNNTSSRDNYNTTDNECFFRSPNGTFLSSTVINIRFDRLYIFFYIVKFLADIPSINTSPGIHVEYKQLVQLLPDLCTASSF